MIVIIGEAGSGKRTLKDRMVTKYPEKFNRNNVLTLGLDELKKLRKLDVDMTVIYLFVDESARIEKMIENGRNIQECISFIKSEQKAYENAIDLADYGIDNTGYHMNPDQILGCLMSILETENN